MRRGWQYVALLVAMLSGVARLSAQEGQQFPLKVDEDRMHFRLLPAPELELPFVNPSGQTVEFSCLLEMIDEKGVVRSSTSGQFQAAPGTTIQKIAWVSPLPSYSPSKLGWFRLRYTLRPRSAPGIASASGVVQLGRIIADAFEVRITGAEHVALGSKYPVRIRVDDPANGHPLRDVPVEVELTIDDDDDHAVTKKLTTDGDGYAVTVFDLPSGSSAKEGEVNVTATRGPYDESEKISFKFLKPATLTVTTDKPLYQPGQTVHMRLLGFGFDKRAWEGAKIEVAIENQESAEEFHSTVTSSKFGVATADWEVPEKLRLGNYSIRAEIESPDADYPVRASAEVRVGRYDLPTFTVTAKPDRPFYLPGQDALIEISADYLFGKPVQRAKVKVVREEQRRWNFKEQRFVANESAAVEGELDGAGKFTAHFSLAERFEDLRKSYDFADISLAAYVTDLSTGRTEQRRFQVRLSHKPVHIYLTTEDPLGRGEPVVVYVTSFYADGTPVSVTGTIEAAQPNDWGELDEDPDAAHRMLIGSFHTNRLGVARVELPPLPDSVIVAPHEQQSYYYSGYWAYRREWTNRDWCHAQLLARGSDTKGLAGTGTQDLSVVLNKDYLEVRTDHALYHQGEAIAVSVVSNTKARDVIIEVSADSGAVASQVVHLRHGKAEVTVPYDPRLRGGVRITAYAMTGVQGEDRALASTAKILFPTPQDLRVGVTMQKTTFRPGETASAGVRVLSPDGKSAESALGVLVFDRAVAERVRSDEDFGRQYGFSIYDYFRYYSVGVAGITYRDLLNLDSTKPFSDDLDLLAGLVLQRSYEYESTGVTLSGSGAEYGREAAAHFKIDEDPELKWVEAALNQTYPATVQYPKNENEFREKLHAAGINPDDVRDPWNVPYRLVFSIAGAYDVLSLMSNGVDKRAGTADDFAATRFGWQYFKKTGEAIDAAASRYVLETGKYIRDYPTLRDELKKRNIDLDALRDPWGTPYAFSFVVYGASFKIEVTSAGPDKRFDNKTHRSWDDVHEWNSLTHYFQQETADLNNALAEHFALTGKFPQNEDELRSLLQAAKLTAERLIDPWGNPYHFAFSVGSRYTDRIDIRDYSEYLGQPRKVTEITPVTQQLAYLAITTFGAENKPEQAFPVAQFSRVMAEQSSKNIKAMATPKEPPIPGGKGRIAGTVTDPMRAVIQDVMVLAVLVNTGQQFTTITGPDGVFTLLLLPTGLYRLEFKAQGFMTSIVLQVPVQAAGTTRVDASLRVGTTNTTVEVTAVAPLVETTQAQISSTWVAHGRPPEEGAKPLFTPRLRKYFPETLLWQPEIITDKNGVATFNFPMADNITSWNMLVIASTLDGKIGVAEKELRTFQPFFLEHDPPKVLTEGDRISLPVVLRNYTDKPQTVRTELHPEPWFSILSAPRQNVTIAPNGDANAVFSFLTTARIKKGTQRVTARNAETGDAVERELTVHPDGEEISFSVAKVLGAGDDALDWEVPSPAIRGSAEAELRIYPNLMAHLLDAIRGLAKRPAGCAEQVTSTSYANLLVLQALKKTGQSDPDQKSPQFAVAATARKHLEDGYRLLSQLQGSDGGFRYWDNQSSDVALTAYVLRFLHGANEFIEIDADILAKARIYILKQQSAAGAWQRYDWQLGRMADDPNISGYVARALALTKAAPKDNEKENGKENEKEVKQVNDSLARVMDYLEAQMSSWHDAYLAGNYALAAVAMGRRERISRAQSMLESLAHNEGAATYWNLEANTTPFYGWGQAGRLETTALVVEALSQLQADKAGSADPQQISRGLQYLIAHKDPYAMWYSTQATQNVLEAMILAMPAGAEGGADATIMVNGKKVSTIKMPSADTITGPITLELDQYLGPGRNQVRVVQPANAAALNATVLASYYVPHGQSAATKEENLKIGDARALRLKVHFDRTDLNLADAVRCEIETERIGFRGYGMMIAEIGLPPGVDVDRASLDKAKESGLISEYDVLPDRVVFYVWPQAGGLKFDFQFHSRFRMDAMTGPSLLYDYYNPDASATVAPVKFSVH